MSEVASSVGVSDHRKTLWVLTGDLYLGTRLRGIGEAAGFTTVSRIRLDREAEIGPSDRIVVDLANPKSAESISVLTKVIDRVAGYAPHVRTDLLKSARSAGLGGVFTKSQLETDFPSWLQS